MSSTRRRSTPGPKRADGYASSPAYAKGLSGNLVAKRAALINDPEARKRVWWLAELSDRQPGLPHYTCSSFPSWPFPLPEGTTATAFEILAGDLCREHPERAHKGAQADLLEFFTRYCLDPECPAEKATVPTFQNVLEALDEYRKKFEAAALARIAPTATVSSIHDLLQFALSQRCLVLASGGHRTGKSYAAQSFAQANLGTCRYVQLTSATDEISFMRSFATALGVASGVRMKASQLRPRVEAVLRTRQLLVIIDESEWLLPQSKWVTQVPARLVYILTALSNFGVPVALLGGINFPRLLASAEIRSTLWDFSQFHGRVRHRINLPLKLGTKDLFAVAKRLLPEASEAMLHLLVGHALAKPLALPALESATVRARYFAAGQPVDLADVRRVLEEAGTFPADAPPAAGEVSAAPSRKMNLDAIRIRRKPAAGAETPT